MAGFDEERAAVTANGIRTDMSTKIAGEDLTNDVLKTEDRSTYTNITASSLIKTGAGRLKGIVVNSHTTATIKLWDGTAASTVTLFNTYTFPTGSSVINLPDVEFSTGLFATIVGTADVTILWK